MIPLTRDSLPTPIFLGFPCGSAGKESACNVGVLGSITGLGRSPEKGKGYPLQYSGLENSIQSMGSQRVGHCWATFTFHYLTYLKSNITEILIFSTLVAITSWIIHYCVQLHWTLYNRMDCSPPGCSAHGTVQARTLEQIAISSSKGFSQPRSWTSVSCVSCTAGRLFTCWTQGSHY